MVKVDQGGQLQQESKEGPHQDSLTQGKVLTAALLVMGLDTMQGTVHIKEGVHQQSHKEDPHVRGGIMTSVGTVLPRILLNMLRTKSLSFKKSDKQQN